VLRFTLEGLIEELERHFDSAHANYMATTEQRTQDFKNLTIKDQTSAWNAAKRAAARTATASASARLPRPGHGLTTA